MTILESGVLKIDDKIIPEMQEQAREDLIKRLARKSDLVIINKKCTYITHYWMVRLGTKKDTVMYFGTPETFEEWKKENEN